MEHILHGMRDQIEIQYEKKQVDLDKCKSLLCNTLEWMGSMHKYPNGFNVDIEILKSPSTDEKEKLKAIGRLIVQSESASIINEKFD